MIFNWILFNKLAIGTPLIIKNDQLLLKEKKINSILDLRNEFDLSKIDYEKQLSLYKEFNLVNVGLPDHNSGRFATHSEIDNVLKILEKLLHKGSVFMHCHAAVERSPLISVAFLMKTRGLSYIQAYEYVKQQNIKTNILQEQLNKIKNLNI